MSDLAREAVEAWMYRMIQAAEQRAERAEQEAARLTKEREELAALVRRLAWLLKRCDPDATAADEAVKYLKCKGLDRATKAIAEAEKACEEFADAAKFQPLADDVTLRECLEVLQYATYHDGRYAQVASYEKFQGPAQRLVKRIADRLGVKPYEGYGA